jgi:hypothetical protein
MSFVFLLTIMHQLIYTEIALQKPTTTTPKEQEAFCITTAIPAPDLDILLRAKSLISWDSRNRLLFQHQRH